MTGRDQARVLGGSLHDRRIAAIWCSDMARAVQTAEIAASVLGVPVRVQPGLREFSVGELAGQPYSDALFTDVVDSWRRGELAIGCPGAETGLDVLARMRRTLESAADEFRGETVLVVSHAGAIRVTLPRLADNVPDDFGGHIPLGDCTISEIAVDADGWVLQSWCGRPVSTYDAG